MNLTADRAAIATAASTAAGVKCRPEFWQISRPGDGLVRMAYADRSADGFGFIVTWQVNIALAQDLKAAEKWIDEHLDELVAAIGAELVVTRVEPVELLLDTGRVPAVVIEGTRAA